jgi:hypothetical protein
MKETSKLKLGIILAIAMAIIYIAALETISHTIKNFRDTFDEKLFPKSSILFEVLGAIAIFLALLAISNFFLNLNTKSVKFLYYSTLYNQNTKIKKYDGSTNSETISFINMNEKDIMGYYENNVYLLKKAMETYIIGNAKENFNKYKDTENKNTNETLNTDDIIFPIKLEFKAQFIPEEITNHLSEFAKECVKTLLLEELKNYEKFKADSKNTTTYRSFNGTSYYNARIYNKLDDALSREQREEIRINTISEINKIKETFGFPSIIPSIKIDLSSTIKSQILYSI